MLDLNLLRIFAAVIEEGSVTAAADRLNLSQPSVTQSLNKLRKETGDDLFQRKGRGITPTRVALELYEDIGRIPTLADAAINRLTKFDPSQARTTFRIALTDLGQAIFLPGLVAGMAKLAPDCSLDIVNLDTDSAGADLVAGHVDLAVSSTLLQGALDSSELRRDRYCCVARPGRFDDPDLSLEEMLHLPRIEVRGSTGHTLIQSLLPVPPAGSVLLSGFAAIPSILSNSDLVAFVPEAITRDWSERWSFEVRPLPLDEYSASVRAHAARNITSPATNWFVQWAIATMKAA